eukprot:TRINITY_DN4905_c0_g1_i1.p2 TRINITY_DN4905_c0_g1~~TRINITY_DN4905_c0_g1_i1.p2  ORF type:complete len:400 (+),score=94.41 TRINITY_DN4905_c0_g1_i1:87-1202(+)
MDVDTPSKRSNPKLPEKLEEQRTRVIITRDGPTHAAGMESHSVFSALGFDNTFDLEDFKQNFKIKILESLPNELSFDLIGVDASIANALRRIMIAEVPTMAFESIYFQNNTSIIPDEQLAHRLGLLPIHADASKFDYHKPGGELSDTDTLLFELKVKCPKFEKDAKKAINGREIVDEEHGVIPVLDGRVYSNMMRFVPSGDQDEIYPDGISLVHGDILIAQLRPGQEIDASCYAHKGIGRDHAKWSPVCPASYQLLPEVTITKPIEGAQAEQLVKTCPMGVFDIEDMGKKALPRARVKNPRSCTVCRECIRDKEWADNIKITRKRDHFIFTIESVGQIPPREIFEAAIKVFLTKIEILSAQLGKLPQAGHL